MPNMSYCRFENTSNDIEDCIEALEEVNWDIDSLLKTASSNHEKRGMLKFIKLCQDVAYEFEE